VHSRLLGLLLTLMAVVLIALGVPLGISMASARTQQTFLDRLNDASRFVSVAQQRPADDDGTLLASQLARYEEVYGIAAAVLDRQGQVLVASRPRLAVPSLGQRAEQRVRAALTGRRSEPPGVIWPWSSAPLVVAEPVINGGDTVGAVITVSSADRARMDIAKSWVLLGMGELAALGVCVILARRLSRWILRPVHDLDVAAHEIATGQMTARVLRGTGPPELRRLAISFNEMAGNVQALVDRQRSFVADASHQLRNPLHALLLRLDSLSMRAPPEWMPEVDAAATEGRHLARMLEGLLELAAVEHGGIAPRQLDLVSIVEQRVDAWAEAFRTKQMNVRRLGCNAPVHALADCDAVSGALNVVIDNAVKFGPAGSTVTVAAYHDAEDAVVSVRDEGQGLAEEELVRVGERFWRSRRHQNIEGFGLGLAIARTLLQQCNGRLEIRPGLPRGLEVLLRFPISGEAIG
jgi:signal transduction histidine kinase